MKKLLVLLSLTFAFSAFASLDGKWSGQGQIQSRKMGVLNCSEVKIEIAHHDSTLDLAISKVCTSADGNQINMDKTCTFEVKNGVLYRDGKAVGTTTENAIHVTHITEEMSGSLTLVKTVHHLKAEGVHKTADDVSNFSAFLTIQ